MSFFVPTYSALFEPLPDPSSTKPISNIRLLPISDSRVRFSSLSISILVFHIFIQVYRLFLEFAFFSYLSYFNLSNLFSCFAVLFTLLYFFDRSPVPTHSTSSWGCLRVVFYFILFCLFVVSYLYGGALAQRLLFSFVVSV